jgi:hypothetical protein
VQIREPEFHQLDEIQFVIHDQNARCHANNLACFAPDTKTARLNPGDKLETKRVGRVTPCAPPIVNERFLVHHDGARGATRPSLKTSQ